MQKYIAELIGSFFLTLALGLSGDSLSTGLLIVGIICAAGQISGAHYSPAVTLAFWAAGRMPKHTLPGYLVSQISGALAGCLFIYFLGGVAFKVVPPGASPPFQYATVELLFGFLLCMVYLMLFLPSYLRYNGEPGLVIGLAYAGILMVGQPITGGTFNPSVALAASVVDFFNYGASYLYLPVYILAPAAGGMIAGNLFSYFMKSDDFTSTRFRKGEE